MKIKDRIAKLIDVKSIVTIILTAVFGYLSINGNISPEHFMTVFAVIISFYFGTQSEKRNNNNNDTDNRGRYEK
jgi:hypothetical protein